jgi:lipopolysaccharide/colanic/teichoic acid biosynthesis glycosyltransferase
LRWTKAKAIKLSVVTLYNLASVVVTCALIEIPMRVRIASPGSEGRAVLAALFAVYFLLMWRDLYARSYHYYLRHAYTIVVRNSLLSAAAVLLFVLVSSVFAADRRIPYLSTYVAAGLASFSVMHVLEFAWIRHLSRLGYFRKNVLTVGNADARLPLQQYFQDVGRTRRYVGSVCLCGGNWLWRPAAGGELPIGSLVEEIKRIILRERVAQVLFLLGPGVDRALLREMTRYCRASSISYYLVADIAEVPDIDERNVSRRGDCPQGTESAVAVATLDYVPIVEAFSAARDSLTSISVKRIADIAIAMTSLVCSLPLWLIIAFAIKAEDGGPVFYVSRRVGKDGTPIRFYKFRTMVEGADERKAQLLPYNERSDGPLFKMSDDPRVTRVGAVLRRLSLDEIPQLLNVLLGNMSLAGPRPHLPEEVACYGGSDYLRLECMPGIVGLPQVVGRNTLGFREWMDLDLRYRREWSLVLDAKIALRAMRIVLLPWLGRTGERSA